MPIAARTPVRSKVSGWAVSWCKKVLLRGFLMLLGFRLQAPAVRMGGYWCGWHPGRGAGEFAALGSGGIAPLNHRLQAGIPAR